MITLFDILVVAAVLAFAWLGGRAGLQTAAIAVLEAFACLAIAVVLVEPVATALQEFGLLLVGDVWPPAWSVLIAFVTLLWGTLAAVRMTLHRRSETWWDTDIPPTVDQVLGAVVGGIGGAIVAGGGLVTLSMLPLLQGLGRGEGGMLLDAGRGMIASVGRFVVDESHEGVPLPVWGEPASRESVAAARLASDPWADRDGDGKFGEADAYRDVDANGTFSANLYYLDVDADGLRRIGLIDKYVVGSWDASLMSDNRARPEPPKAGAATTSKPTQAKGPGTPATSGTSPTPSTKPVKPKPGSRPAEPPPPATEKGPDDDF